ncbi:MAG: hypothetical protein ACYS8K_04305 [Planctomycetota bacterium]
MRRKRKPGKGRLSRPARLALIRQRHRKLILEPRAAIATDFDREFEDGFDDVLEADQLEVAQAVELSQA